MEIRDSLQRYLDQQNKQNHAWAYFFGALVLSGAVFIWSMLPLFGLAQPSALGVLGCLLSIVSGALTIGCLRPLSSVYDIDEASAVPDATFHWIAEDDKVSTQAKADIADALSQVESATFKMLLDYDNKLADRARDRNVRDGAGYRALMGFKAGSKN
ncbi:hypothetical protein [Burkholderia sp. Tr-20390]|uniref:hypothetical protein n=1 Tax=Burkholderia sp. Tr-20390 TaxID=2703904 RepID=UPI00197E1DA7|nr:hypothetical protein [Burkholderia sp. Tr-20390]MBN3733150.1 hypothetical protein [Burkholderia sp. Tr-20390]